MSSGKAPAQAARRISGLARRSALPAALAACLLAPPLLTGCARAPQYVNAAAEVDDLRTMPQSVAVLAEAYAAESGSGVDALLRRPAEARADMARWRERFFEPWEAAGFDPADMLWLLEELDRAPSERGTAENMHPWSGRSWQELVDNAALESVSVPELLRRRPLPAVTVRSADLRAAPTLKPRFSQAHGAGAGWPFDLFQLSRLHAGTPLAVYHKSRDGAWLLVRSAESWGWLRAEDAAAAGKAFRRLWQGAKFCAFIREGVGLKFKALGAGGAGSAKIPQGSYLATADIGTVLPCLRAGEVLLPMRGLDGEAYAVTASFADWEAPSRRSPELYDQLSRPAVRMPLLLTPGNVARVGDRMMGQPYGWGGLYGRRDCSATMQDLFAPFGLWLPRNSKDQGEEGRPQSLEGLSASAKERALREKARPFRTLIAMPGHIGLYAGQWEGKAAMFHTMWGVKNSVGGEEGRLVIGRSVVTGLRPGEERGDVDEERLLIERVKAFTVLGLE